MKEINIGQATAITSPDPLVLVCAKKEDGTLNMAPVSFFLYASFNPPMLAFAMGKAANSGDHCLYLCSIDKMVADDTKEALFAWDGYAKVAPAQEK